MTKLLPCPFCGEHEHLYRGNKGGEFPYYIECCQCLIKQLSYPTEQKSVDAWNTRTQDVTVEKELIELRQTVQDICGEVFALFQDEPLKSTGEYFHLGICSGSRRKPIGASGCACKSAAIFKRSKNPHDWILKEQTRIPERGINWDTYECSKCKWIATYNPDMDVEKLNQGGWCPA